jgi:hypothetical protein
MGNKHATEEEIFEHLDKIRMQLILNNKEGFEEDSSSLFKLIDTNHNHSISYDEWKNFDKYLLDHSKKKEGDEKKFYEYLHSFTNNKSWLSKELNLDSLKGIFESFIKNEEIIEDE